MVGCDSGRLRSRPEACGEDLGLAERGEKIDIFFLDPPYREGLYDKCFALIREYDLLADEGIIVAEHGERDDFPDAYEGFQKLKERTYGSIAITIYG